MIFNFLIADFLPNFKFKKKYYVLSTFILNKRLFSLILGTIHALKFQS